MTATSALLLSLLLPALAFATTLPENPMSLREKANRIRESQERTWDPATGRLGNLKTVNLVAPGCTVRIVSGAENKILSSLDSVSIERDRSSSLNSGANSKPSSIDVTLKTHVPKDTIQNGQPCLILQIATVDDLLIRGDSTDVLFDHVRTTDLRIFLNPSNRLRIWFEQVHFEHLVVNSNAWASVAGNGKADWLTLDSSQSSTKLLFHQMDADHIGVSATTTRVQFSIRIRPGADAGYSNPARAPGKIALEYPIWIEGRLESLEVPAGHVNPQTVTQELKAEADAIRKNVIDRVGLQPSSSKVTSPDSTEGLLLKPSARQRVADAFAAYLQPGMSLTDVQMFKNGGALEGTAPNKQAAADLVTALTKSPDVAYSQLASTKPVGAKISFRALFDLSCKADAPGTAPDLRQLKDLCQTP